MPLTMADVEEALRHLQAVPADERGAGWHSYCDSLLEQRIMLAGTAEQLRDTRIMFSTETR